MKRCYKFQSMLLLAVLTLFAFSCEKNDDNDSGKMGDSSNIVETAQDTDALSSLVAALMKADEKEETDLIGTLSGDGPFTVFAPTNDAFTALLNELDGYNSLEDFKTDMDKMILAKILSYHVVSGIAAKSTNLEEGQEIETVQGEKVKISLEGGVSVKDKQDESVAAAKVVVPNVEASNGVVHVIDQVLLPQEVLDMLNSAGTLVDIVVETESLSVLEAAVLKADLAGTLSGDGPFTVFAPTDDAFVALLEALGDDYNSLDDFDEEAEIALLKDILLYHVVASEVKAADLSEGSVPMALPENSIEVIASGDTFVIGDASDVNANITGTDIMASNGVAHTIDKVLLPQSAIDFVNSLNAKNLVEIVVETETLSVLEAAVIKAGLAETLKGDGPFTVFAPTDDAFVALLEALGDDYNSLDDFDEEAEIALLKDILLYHVVASEVKAADLSEGSVPTALPENSIEVIASGDTFVIGDASDVNANITGTDIMASNGVAHTIDKVLLPQSAIDFVNSLSLKTIVEIAVATDDLSLLVEALGKADAGLVDVLSGDGPFTVFAPTNDAFVALLDYLGDDYNSLADFDTAEEKALLVKVLTYHVVGGTAAFSDGLSDGQKIKTEQGEYVTIKKNGGVFIKDATDMKAEVVGPDVEASNGVVHVINKVLLPQEVLDILNPNIVGLAQSVDDLSLLVEALIQADAGLVDVLSGNGRFTVFAPTNQAFKDLLAMIPDCGSISDFDTPEEKALLAKILTYHVVAGAAVESSTLTNHQEIVTEQGESLFAIVNGHDIDIRDKTDVDANVVIPDQMASNGIVHVVDKVLLPQEVLDMLEPNIVGLAQSVDDLSLLVDALIQADAGLVDVLSGDGPFTVFAPTNEAFAGLLHTLGSEYNSLADFDTQAEKDILAIILKYHVVAGAAVESSTLTNHQEIVTEQGESLFAIVNGHDIDIRDKTHVDANVVIPDQMASNGIVHVIDKVLLPQEALTLLGH